MARAKAAPSLPEELGHQFGAMLARMPVRFLRMAIEDWKGGNTDNRLFVILRDIDEKLSELGPGAVKVFCDAAGVELPNEHRVPFDELAALAWCSSPPGLLDRLLPGLSQDQVRDALAAWDVREPAAVASLLDVLRLDESMQRAARSDAVWRYTWQVDELVHRRPLVGRTLRLSAGVCPCWEEAGSAVITGVRASGSSREGVGFRTFGLTPSSWEVTQASDTDLMVELGPRRMVSSLTVASLCGCGNELTRPGYVLLQYPKSARCRREGGCLFSASSLYVALRSGLSTIRSGPAFTAVAKQSERTFAYDVDVVLSLPDVAWPSDSSDSYERRQRYEGCVTAAMVRRLVSAKLYMVAAGFKNSPSAEHQWRYSFSKQEYILMRLLPPAHRQCLVALKICKNLLGSRIGQLKTYHLKTGVLWIAELRSTTDDVHAQLVAVLDFLLDCVIRGTLSCFFWQKINLLAALTADDLDELRTSLRLMRNAFLSILNLYVYRAVLGVEVKGSQNSNMFSGMSDVDFLCISVSSFRKFCADRLHLNAYRRHRVQAMLAEGQNVLEHLSRLPLSVQRQIDDLLHHPLPDGSAHLVHAIRSAPAAMEPRFPLRRRLSALGTEYWQLDLSWFFQPRLRDSAVPFLDVLDDALSRQATLPPERRLPGLPAELCRPVELLSAGQLCRLYTQQEHLLAELVYSEEDFLVPRNLARQDAESVTQFLRHLEPPDLVDTWMEHYG